MPRHPTFAPKDDEADEDLARGCIARLKASIDSPEWESLFWTWDRLHYLTDQLPDKTWRITKLIVSMDHSPEIIENLIDWPINDLLMNFGIEMIDIVEGDINRLSELHPLLSFAQQLEELRTSWTPSEFRGRVRDGSIGQALAPKDDEADEDLARAWIDFEKTERQSEKSFSLFWTFQRMCYLTEYLPQKAFRVILLIWSMDQSTETMQSISAGPVEDLLARHGDEMIALVEEQAGRDPSFAKMLGGVWKSSMTGEVWARLQAVWDRRGWDGIPDTPLTS